MQETYRIAELPQSARFHDFVGKRIGESRWIGGQRTRGELAERFLRESGCRRIDGRQPIGQRRIVGHDLELRMHDLGSVIAFADVAEHAHARTARKRFLVARIEREEAQDERCATFGIADRADELAPGPVLDLRLRNDPFALDGFADTDVAQRDDPRVVLVAQRQVQHEVFVARYADARELVGDGVAFRRRIRSRRRPLRARDCARWIGHFRPRVIHLSRGNRRQPPGTTRIASTSNCAPRGNAATCYVARAGYGAWKYDDMMSLTLANSPRSASNIDSLTMSSSFAPDAAATARKLRNT